MYSPNIKLQWLTKDITSEFAITVKNVKEAVIEAGVQIGVKSEHKNENNSPAIDKLVDKTQFFESQNKQNRIGDKKKRKKVEYVQKSNYS